MNYLNEISETNKLGISIKDLLLSCEKLGFYAKALKLRIQDLANAPLPLVLYWNNNHFIVLYKINLKKNRFYVVDPALGKLTLKEDDFLKLWMEGDSKGIAILLEPTPNFFESHNDSEDNTILKLKGLLYSSIRENKKSFTIICLLTVIGMIADASIPFIFKTTIDEGINGKNIDLVLLLIWGQFFIFLGNYLSNSISSVVLTKLGLNLSFNLMSNYLKTIVLLPMRFFDCKVNSDLIQKIDDQNRIKNFLISLPNNSIISTINFVIFSVILSYYNFWIWILFISFSLVGFCWILFFQRKRREVDYSNFIYLSENKNNLYELINGMSEIKVHNAQKSKVDIWENLQKKINKLSVKSTFINLAQNSGSVLFTRIKDIAITGICASMVIGDQMTIGIMMTINYIIGRLSQPISSLYTSANLFQDASISYERLDSIINYPIEEKCMIAPTKQDDIIIQDMSFKYPGSFSPYVLSNFNCVIPHGKITAIVGASGSGKTTLIKLLMGFYQPQQGLITHNGKSISEYVDDSWLANFGVVMQNGYIFSSSIKDNIALSDPTPDMDLVKFAAKQACIDTFIENLPMGYNTKIGSSGIELSGGQKQRLLIARVIYKNPNIIILDEATSSLDAQNEKMVVNNLNDFGKGKTMIIAAHRLSTVRNADQIIFIDNGMVKESGTHEELIKLKGGYYNLIKNQLELNL